jgi:DNA-binding transcriptional LysR family regulator
VAKSHALAKKPKINVAKLPNLPLLLGEGKVPGIDVIERNLPAPIELDVEMKFESPGALKAAVLRGLGVGLLYEDMVVDELQSGALKEIRVAGLDLSGQSCLVYRKDKPLSGIAAKFVEIARLHRDQNLGFEKPVKSTSRRAALPGSIGKQQTPKRDAAGVLIER